MGPYEIFQRVGKVVYQLILPSELDSVHQVFHLSMSKKCIGDPESILPIKCLGVDENLSYEEVLVEILDHQVKRLSNKVGASVKMLWRNHIVEGATQEGKDDMKSRYPYVFGNSGQLFLLIIKIRNKLNLTCLAQICIIMVKVYAKMSFHGKMLFCLI